MRAILPRSRPATEDPQINFVQNRGCLRGVSRALAAHFTGRDPMQLAVDQFRKSIRSFGVAQTPTIQERPAGMESGGGSSVASCFSTPDLTSIETSR